MDVAQRLLDLGVDELSIGDTIGVAVPADVRRVVGALARRDRARTGWRCTSTTRAARRSPTSSPRSSSASAASMPRPAGPAAVPTRPAPPATSPPRTSVYLLDREGLTHGVDLDRLLVAARHVSDTLGRP